MDLKNKEIIREQAEKYDSFYLYDEQVIVENTLRLISNFNCVEFLYSIKSNPALAVAQSVFKQGFGADAASLEEVKLAHKLGVSSDKIQFSAPGKTDKVIEEAMDLCTIIADSIGEVYSIQNIAKSKNVVVAIGIRINPNFTFSGYGGVSSKFGIDENQVFDMLDSWKNLPNVKIVGIHVHLRSQELDYHILEGYYNKMFVLADEFQSAIGYKLEFINMGSGLGIPYSSKDKHLDTVSLGKSIKKQIDEFKSKMPYTKIILETGRYVVGKSGIYVTKVLDKKVSMDKTFVILCNTLNGFIRPSLAQLVTFYAGNNPDVASEPLFTSSDAFSIQTLSDESEQEVVTLVGNLCTATDVVAKDILMPKLNRGDIIIISNAGSYASVLSPFQFSSQQPPAQLFLSCHGLVSNATDVLPSTML